MFRLCLLEPCCWGYLGYPVPGYPVLRVQRQQRLSLSVLFTLHESLDLDYTECCRFFLVFWSAVIMLPSQSFMFHSDYSQTNVFWDRICWGSPYGGVINPLPFHVTFILKKLMSGWYFKPCIVLFISSVALYKWKCQWYKTVTLIERMKTGVVH